ncbi:MAG: ABC transporter permease subunit [Oscillospiraceae bacterium]|nr:ABC transporter permease subunit [Oscillospiraceae bacterium]
MSWLFEFPIKLSPDTRGLDSFIRGIAVRYAELLDAGKAVLNALVTGANFIIGHVPWFLLIGLVFFLGWRSHKRFRTGALYAVLLFLIGLAGLWDLMILTLSIVLVGVVIALIIGFPAGILLSYSTAANNIVRPVLDTMQTMPVFVYMIPAVIFFGMGNASAVIATVIYAMVPVIRLTSLGIRQIDKEVVEAASAFGSTRWQALIKVQIPQALPTIMAGVNQTLMMAMSMVVTASLIGARGLGNEVLVAVNRIEIGRGLLAGGSVVIIAILLDRLTQGWFETNEKNRAEAENRKGRRPPVDDR